MSEDIPKYKKLKNGTKTVGQFPNKATQFSSENQPEKNGRPRKFVSTLKEQGYKLSEINDTLMALLSMDMQELKEAFENPKATVLEKAVAGAIKKAIEKGSLYNIETIITRAMGKPKEQVDVTSGGDPLKFDISLKL